MENASKALLMAAGVLITLIIIGAFMLMMSNLTDYQQKSYQSKVDAQTLEFNNQYVTFARDNIRGNDMISLMNKIVDYNTRHEGQGYTPMEVSIDMNGYNDDLLYDTREENQLVIRDHYNQDNIDEIVGLPKTFRDEGEAGGIIRELEEKYQQKYIDQLATEISTVAGLAEDGSSDAEQEFVDLKLLPIDDVDDLDGYGGLDGIYKDASLYYEYIQFKRTTFDCTGTEFDEESGRIIRMEFECTGIGV